MINSLTGPRNPFNNYDFESAKNVERLLPYRKGTSDFWLGRSDSENRVPVGLDDNRHVMTVAGSRSGKGTTAIIPNLLLCEGSVFCLDPKGENATKTAARRGSGANGLEGLKQKVVVLDPFQKAADIDAYRGRFNPLEAIDINSHEAVDLAADLADAIVVSTGEKNAHWDESAKNLLKSLILHVKTFPLRLLVDFEVFCKSVDDDEEMIPDLVLVRDLLMSGAVHYAELLSSEDHPPVNSFDALLETMCINTSCGGVIAATAKALQSLGATERGSVVSTARRNTEFLDSPSVRENLRGKSSFHPFDLKQKTGGVSVYVCLPSARLHTHFRWMRMILVSVLTASEQPIERTKELENTATGHPTLFVLDEFAQLERLDTVEKAAGLMAGYGVKLWVIVQDLTQLQRLYEKSWETFVGNAGILQFFGVTDLTTLRYLSDKIGRYDVAKKEGGRGNENDLITPAELEKILCREAEVEKIYSQGHALSITLLAGRRPLLLPKTPYYSDQTFKGLFA